MREEMEKTFHRRCGDWVPLQWINYLANELWSCGMGNPMLGNDDLSRMMKIRMLMVYWQGLIVQRVF